MNIGISLRRLRQLKGYSQEYVAIQLGISNKTYLNLENNKSKLDLQRFIKLAGVLNVHPVELFLKILEESGSNSDPANKHYCTENSYKRYQAELRAQENIIHYLESKLNMK